MYRPEPAANSTAAPWRDTPPPRAFRPRPDAGSPTAAMVARALEEGRVTVAFQRVVDARCLQRTAFHEALVRIELPGGPMAPGQFLPAIAGTPLAAAVDRVVLARALTTLEAEPDLRLAVNIGPATLDDPEWLAALSLCVGEAPDIGYRLIVEMTEDAGVLDHPSCDAFLARLRAMGVSVALDDFGAGATGFHHFRGRRFDILKIDGSYGDGLDANADAQALVTAMVGLARHFEMLTVIEHVDTPRDAARAMQLGVDCLQGFLFGRPAPSLGANRPQAGAKGRSAG